MAEAREAIVTFTLYQNVSINLDVFERVYSMKPTKANILEVASGMCGHTDDAVFEFCVHSGGAVVVETEITDWPGPKVKDTEPKVKRGRGSY